VSPKRRSRSSSKSQLKPSSTSSTNNTEDLTPIGEESKITTTESAGPGNKRVITTTTTTTTRYVTKIVAVPPTATTASLPTILPAPGKSSRDIVSSGSNNEPLPCRRSSAPSYTVTLKAFKSKEKSKRTPEGIIEESKETESLEQDFYAFLNDERPPSPLNQNKPYLLKEGWSTPRIEELIDDEDEDDNDIESEKGSVQVKELEEAEAKVEEVEDLESDFYAFMNGEMPTQNLKPQTFSTEQTYAASSYSTQPVQLPKKQHAIRHLDEHQQVNTYSTHTNQLHSNLQTSYKMNKVNVDLEEEDLASDFESFMNDEKPASEKNTKEQDMPRNSHDITSVDSQPTSIPDVEVLKSRVRDLSRSVMSMVNGLQ